MALYTIDNRPRPIDFECNNNILMRTLQNAKNLIMCQMGEIPYDRMRGINPVLFDLGIAEANEQIMPEIDRVLGWEPDAKAVSASVVMEDNGDVVIIAVIEVNL